MAADPIPFPQLQLHSTTSGSETTVTCVGKLTRETSSQLKSEVKPSLTSGCRVTLDLSDVQYMDSSGLGAIVGLLASAKTHGCELRLVNLAPRVRELFRITKLITVFEPFGEHL